MILSLRKNKTIFTAAAAIAVLITVLMVTSMINVGASDDNHKAPAKSYVSVKIEKGDSLWSIAKDNVGPGYEDIEEYIQVIKKVNRLSSDTIHEGGYIIVPKYLSKCDN